MDLNPVADDPSAWRPHCPNTERRDTLKMYGDAEVTVSVLRDTVAPATVGVKSVGVFCTVYLNTVLLIFSLTTCFPSYPVAEIPSITIGVSTSRPVSADSRVTVTVVPVAVTLEMPTLPEVAPTIRYSSILG